MAQSDFLIYTASATPLLNSGGTARFHSDLTPTYTSGGVYYRSLEPLYPAATNGSVFSFVPVTGALTSSTGYPYGKAYSMRAACRIISGSTLNTAFSLVFKGNSKLSITDSPSANQALFTPASPGGSGYRLIVAGNTNLKLKCSNFESTASGSLFTLANSPAATTWLKIRMDIIPVTGAYDIIKIYTGSLQNDSWSLIFNTNINNQDTTSYVPWNFGSQTNNNGYLGFVGYSAVNAGYAIVDDFQVFTEDI